MKLFLQKCERHCVCGDDRFGVLNQIAEFTISVFTQGSVQRNRFTTVLLDLDDLLRCHIQFLRQFFRRRFTAKILKHLTLNARELIDDFNHVHGNANGSRLVRHGTRNCLANPPRSVGRELVALRVVELLDCTNQTKIAFLNQIQELHTASGVTLRKRNHKAQVGLEKVILCVLTILRQNMQLTALARALFIGARLEDFLSVETGFNTTGKINLLLGIEQGYLTDLLEVVLHRVGCRASDGNLLDWLICLIRVRNDEPALRTELSSALRLRILVMCRRLIIFRIFVFYVVIVSFDLGIFQIVDIGFNVFDYFQISVFGDIAFKFLIVLRGHNFLRSLDLSCLLPRPLRALGSFFHNIRLRVLRRLLTGRARLLFRFRLRGFLLLSLLCAATLLGSGFLCLCKRFFLCGCCLLSRTTLLGS